MKNIDTVREHLFNALDALGDTSGKVDLERIEATRAVAQTIINAGKLEVDYLKASGNTSSDFLEPKPMKALPKGITGVHVHKLK